MTVPLPAVGDTDWMDWATQLDAQGRAVAGKASTPAVLAAQRLASARWDNYQGGADNTPLLTRNGGRTASGHPQGSQFVASPSGDTPAAADSVVDTLPDGSRAWRLKASGADYVWTSDPGEIDQASMGFAWLPGGSTKNAAVCLAISRNTGPTALNTGGLPNGVFGTSIHISIAPDIIRTTLTGPTGLLSFESGDALVASGLGLPVDGTPLVVHCARTSRDRIRITITSAAGVHYDSDNAAHPRIRDSRIPAWWGSTVGQEHLRPLATFATDYEPVILPWQAGPPVRRPTAYRVTAAAQLGGGRYDDYATDGTMQTLPARAAMPSGHPYTLAVIGAGGVTPVTTDIKVLEGEVWLQNRGAFYAWTSSADEDVDEATMTMRWKPGTTAGVTAFCMLFSRVKTAGSSGVDPFLTGIHLSIQRDRILVQENVNGTVGVSADSMTVPGGNVAYSAAIPDSVDVTLTARRVAPDRLRLTIPGYLDTTVTVPRMPVLWGSTVGIETVQSESTWATDPRPVIRGHRVGSAPRRGLGYSGVGTNVGLLGGATSYALATLNYVAGRSYAFLGLELPEPVRITAVYAQVITAVAGGKIRPALHLLDSGWKQNHLLADFGEIPLDAAGVQVISGLSLYVPPGRWAPGLRASAAVDLRTWFYYSTPKMGAVRNLLDATPYATSGYKTEAYGPWPAGHPANPSSPIVPWDTTTQAASAGCYCPLLFACTAA